MASSPSLRVLPTGAAPAPPSPPEVAALSEAFRALPSAQATQRVSARAALTPHSAEKLGRAVGALTGLIAEAAARGDFHVTIVDSEEKGGVARHPERRLCPPVFELRELDLLLFRHLMLKRGYRMDPIHVAGLHREDITWKPRGHVIGEYWADAIADTIGEREIE